MPRPWTGGAPLPPSKKKLWEFDSFRLPPPHKKGVKPVQAPGPFLPGPGPMYVKSREEILGKPLTEEEIKELIEGCRKTKRQLNMGRDGLTHNMFDNIHAHWKRWRVCKIKCKGVRTVDIDNVRQQLESSLPKPERDLKEAKESDVRNVISVAQSVEGEGETTSTGSVHGASRELLGTSTLHRSHEVMRTEGTEDSSSMQHVEPCSSSDEVSNEMKTSAAEHISDVQISIDDRLAVTNDAF